ncbi:MAG TPA: beta-galactosidase, partial [Planctomycetota bacterium]|nr:beta-galactosidase [Planctomycetota bacterium]
NPQELVRDRAGNVFRWHPFVPAIGPGHNTLPSLASTRFLDAVARWYEVVLERVFRPHLGAGRPLLMVQLDNECNGFWSDAYWIDFHPAALARWRERLRARYGSIEALSEAYGRRYRSFEEVRPPRKGRGPAAAHRDWFEHQHALVGEYLDGVRAIWARLGVGEPDVLFLTNDTHQTFAGRDFILPNGLVKNRRGLHALDTYPRAIPVWRPRRILVDRPYEPDFHNKLNDVYNDLYLGPSRFTLGIEIQGGHFDIPLRGRTFTPHKIGEASTTQTYLRLIAHGMKALAIYILVGGLNLDGTKYTFQAAVALDGALHPRYAGVRRVGRMIRRFERELLESEAVESRVAVLASARALGPGYGHAGEQRIFGDELRACFGWLANAGFTPRVLDLELASEADLAAAGTLLFPTSGRFDAASAAKLERFVAAGGTLIQALRRGPLAAGLLRAEVEASSWRRFGLSSHGLASFRIDGGGGSVPALLRGVERFRLDPDAERVLWCAGEEPLALGFARRAGRGRAIFLGTLPTDCYASGRYFTEPAGALESRAFFARRLLRGSGERRLFAFDGVREECHARRVPSTGALFLFVFASHDAGTTVLRLRDLEALGLRADGTYAIEDVFLGEEPRNLGSAWTGEKLREDGIALELADGGATVLRLAVRD